MKSEYVDALIIGAGVTGLTAAEIIGEKGFKTIVVASGYGCSQASSGTIDVLGRYKGKNIIKLDEALGEFVEENVNHVYAVAGKNFVLKALSGFHDKNNGFFVGKSGHNMDVITPIGVSKKTYLVQFTMQEASLENLAGNKVMIVAIPNLTCYAPHIIAGKMREEGVNAEVVKLDLSAISPFQLATVFESNPEKLAEKLKATGANNYDRVIIPPILGLRNIQEVLQAIEELLGTKLIEIPSFPPSVPGKRLYLLLKERCEKVGVTVTLGEVASRIKVEKGEVKEVITDKKRYTPSFLVLATGWLLNEILRIKGIPKWRRKNVFNFKVEGVENLFIAQSSVSHEESIGLGAAITAGYLAGNAAIEYLR